MQMKAMQLEQRQTAQSSNLPLYLPLRLPPFVSQTIDDPLIKSDTFTLPGMVLPLKQLPKPVIAPVKAPTPTGIVAIFCFIFEGHFRARPGEAGSPTHCNSKTQNEQTQAKEMEVK